MLNKLATNNMVEIGCVWVGLAGPRLPLPSPQTFGLIRPPSKISPIYLLGDSYKSLLILAEVYPDERVNKQGAKRAGKYA